MIPFSKRYVRRKPSVITPPPPPPADPTPFNPGHYLAPAMQNKLPIVNGVRQGDYPGCVSGYPTMLSTVVAHPVLLGLKQRYYWNFFENLTPAVTDDDYDFASTLGVHLTDCGTRNKKLHVLIALTISSGNDYTVDPSICPKYMVNGASTGTYEGGQWGYGSAIGGPGGFRIRLANTQVKNKFYAMLGAMCRYLKNHPHFDALEAICFSESAQGSPAPGYTEPNAVATINAMMGAWDLCQSIIPNRLIYQSVNHPRPSSLNVGENTETLLAVMETKKYGFGTPNIVPGDEKLNSAPDPSTGFGEGVLHKMPNYPGARIPEAQGADYKWSQIEYDRTAWPYAPTYTFGGDYIPTMTQLFNKLVSLGAHYAIWAWEAGNNPQNSTAYMTSMLNLLDTKEALPAGGLVATRPTKFPT